MSETNGTPETPSQPLRVRVLRLRLVRKVILEKRGNITRIAEALGRSRQSVYEYLDRNADKLADVLAEAQEVRLDKAEGSLDDAIDRGEGWAVKALLEQKGRKRGYGRILSHVGGIDQATGEDLPISITLPDNGRENNGAENPGSQTGADADGPEDRPATGSTV